jgi:hypothetical protein
MSFRGFLLAAAGACALGAISNPGQAASFGIGSTLQTTSYVDHVAYHRCWRQNGKRHCRRVSQERRYRQYGYNPYYEHDADRLPVGSSRWFEQMEREGRFNAR